jgi:hypothetical protein
VAVAVVAVVVEKEAVEEEEMVVAVGYVCERGVCVCVWGGGGTRSPPRIKGDHLASPVRR